jgi:hypothetical protein
MSKKGFLNFLTAVRYYVRVLRSNMQQTDLVQLRQAYEPILIFLNQIFPPSEFENCTGVDAKMTR